MTLPPSRTIILTDFSHIYILRAIYLSIHLLFPYPCPVPITLFKPDRRPLPFLACSFWLSQFSCSHFPVLIPENYQLDLSWIHSEAFHPVAAAESNEFSFFSLQLSSGYLQYTELHTYIYLYIYL